MDSFAVASTFMLFTSKVFHSFVVEEAISVNTPADLKVQNLQQNNPD